MKTCLVACVFKASEFVVGSRNGKSESKGAMLTGLLIKQCVV